jgi:hypothetical protein
MDRVASLMEDVGKRLGAATTNETRALSGDLKELVAETRSGVSAKTSVDESMSARLDRANSSAAADNSLHSPGGRQRPMTGTDMSTGKDVEITAENVESVPLVDAQGRPAGVLFPSKPTDVDTFEPWTRMQHRESDLYYRTAYQTPPGYSPGWVYGPRENTPWQKEVLRTGQSPIYVVAHANPYAYSIRLNVDGVPTKVFVDGSTYGRVIAGNQHFLHATEGKPYTPLVSLSCSPGRTGSATGQFTADYLIDEAEEYRNIHFGGSTLMLEKDENAGVSWLGSEAVVTRNGLHLPQFQSYWGSPWSHEDRG